MMKRMERIYNETRKKIKKENESQSINICHILTANVLLIFPNHGLK